ncbi:MAG TPA: 1,4-alpha-glucan branching protein domain-containing protein [Treponemataceae bacterium]|nr:1,4-alpha-glucan branching protein domain-containing protein [Treponemataceae bacterium]
MANTSLIFVINAQFPFIRHPEAPGCVEETRFFNALSYTWLPLLRTCTNLDAEGIPFKFALVFSPSLCEMFADQLLQDRYIETLDRAIEFGLSELERNTGSNETRELIKLQLDIIQLNRRDFVEIYERNILKKIDYFANRGYIEILATTATACFLPLFADIPEAVNAQIETGLMSYRTHFTSFPSGFWLPAMAYSHGIEEVIKSYGFQYTILESHGLLFADPPPDAGLFAPAWCPNGLAVLGRDKRVSHEVYFGEDSIASNPVYLNVDRDIGFELDEESLSGLFDVRLGRRITGFRYWSRNGTGTDSQSLYRFDEAHSQICSDAATFLDRRYETLSKASAFLEGAPVSITCVFPAEVFGQSWYEGISWLENLFRLAAVRRDVLFAQPSSCLQVKISDKRVEPYCSSWFDSGYAEEVLNNSNDWMYSYIRTATLRMVDLAERFPGDSGLKERSLNMAARELFLAQSIDWFLLMNEGDKSEYGRSRFEESVKAFTVVYESLGSNFISTEWLTTIEKRHNLFSAINYRVFRKKK